MKSGPNPRSLFGFTIVELLVVIVVIGILAAITIVSYAGVTSRATIATIQSDLSSASKILKMDQTNTTTDNFPTTLNLANSGKGITPSQTMDSVIYIPDNTSNPKNFCLQYRKGTTTYAVDNNSQPGKGVCLSNLVGNNNFSSDSNSDGMADGWNVGGTNKSVANNIQRMTATLNGNILSYDYTNIIGHVYYYGIKVKTNSALVNLNNGFIKVSHTGSDSFELLSWVHAATTTGSPHQGMYDERASGWTEIQVKEAIRIDLTESFGAGKEPTQAQINTMIGNYPNNWFNITAKANS